MNKIILFFMAAMLMACDGSTAKFREMPDSELRRERSVCRSIKNPSPGKAIACDNIENEYQRRLKERMRPAG